MTQSQTITIVAKQRMGNKPKSSWKIVTETGEELKAWAADGFKLDVGTSYNIVIDEVVSKNPEYPGSDFFINPKFNKAKGNGEDTHAPIPLPGVTKTLPSEKDEDIAALAIFKTVFQKGDDIADCLGLCNAGWKKYKARQRTPEVKAITKKDLVEEDWEEFSAT